MYYFYLEYSKRYLKKLFSHTKYWKLKTLKTDKKRAIIVCQLWCNRNIHHWVFMFGRFQKRIHISRQTITSDVFCFLFITDFQSSGTKKLHQLRWSRIRFCKMSFGHICMYKIKRPAHLSIKERLGGDWRCKCTEKIRISKLFRRKKTTSFTAPPETPSHPALIQLLTLVPSTKTSS